jgi:protein TonB
MIEPRVLNQEEVERALARNYPPLLRDAGIGGQVEVQLWLDEKGGVVRAEISRTSGYEALDAAALKVVDVMRLSPALNRSQPTRVIVTIPIVFRAR